MCVCVSKCVPIFICRSECACAHSQGQKRALIVLFSLSPCLSRALSLNLRLARSWLGRKPRGPSDLSISISLGTRITGLCRMSGLLCRRQTSNSSSHYSTAISLSQPAFSLVPPLVLCSPFSFSDFSGLSIIILDVMCWLPS